MQIYFVTQEKMDLNRMFKDLAQHLKHKIMPLTHKSAQTKLSFLTFYDLV